MKIISIKNNVKSDFLKKKNGKKKYNAKKVLKITIKVERSDLLSLTETQKLIEIIEQL